MRNVSERSCRESQNTNYMFFNFSENLASCNGIEKYGAALLVIQDNMVQPCWLYRTIWCSLAGHTGQYGAAVLVIQDNIMLHRKGSLGMRDN